MIDPNLLKPLSDEFIDRIVDGEVTPAELRDAINRLDQEPDAWKRCALAFLESQCWRESLRAVGQPAHAPVESPVSTIPLTASLSTKQPSRWLRRIKMAATVAASFVLGWICQSWRPTATSGRGDPVITHIEPVRSTTESEESAVVGRVVPMRTASSPPQDDRSSLAQESVKEVARLVISSDSAQTEVPILSGPGIDTEWVKNQPPPISEYEQFVFQRHGYQVDQRRRLISTTLPDGRRVTVPIDQVQIRYTGNQPL